MKAKSYWSTCSRSRPLTQQLDAINHRRLSILCLCVSLSACVWLSVRVGHRLAKIARITRIAAGYRLKYCSHDWPRSLCGQSSVSLSVQIVSCHINMLLYMCPAHICLGLHIVRTGFGGFIDTPEILAQRPRHFGQLRVIGNRFWCFVCRLIAIVGT